MTLYYFETTVRVESDSRLQDFQVTHDPRCLEETTLHLYDETGGLCFLRSEDGKILLISEPATIRSIQTAVTNPAQHPGYNNVRKITNPDSVLLSQLQARVADGRDYERKLSDSRSKAQKLFDKLKK